jgi:hypothetical protein
MKNKALRILDKIEKKLDNEIRKRLDVCVPSPEKCQECFEPLKQMCKKVTG